MLYVITPADKRKQRDLLYQLWRFAALSVRFLRLIQLERRPSRGAHGKSVEQVVTTNG